MRTLDGTLNVSNMVGKKPRTPPWFPAALCQSLGLTKLD